MGTNVLDVCKRDSGKIWYRKPSPSSSNNGLVVSIVNTVSSSLSLHPRNVRFLHSTFDVKGDSFVAGDHQGSIYVFDLNKNRFSLVQRTGTPCTALAFTLRRRTEFLVGMSDYSLKCYDTESKELIAWMKGHDSAIHTISVHASGRYALTASSETAQLWDLDTFQRKRKLNIKENVGIVKVFFIPLSNTIVTCFKDDSIFAWESDTLNCKFQLPVPQGKTPHYKTFACTRDGSMLAAGGKSNFLHIWSLESHQLVRIIQMPSKVKVVRQLDFLSEIVEGGAGQILAVLSQDGIARFINTDSCKLLFDIGSIEDGIMNISISPSGHHVVAITGSGRLDIYSAQYLSEEINKPPPALLKVVGEKMNDTGTTQSSMLSKSSNQSYRRIKHPARKGNTSHNQSDLPNGLDKDKMHAILKGYGEYPAKYRFFIWRSLLRLPENHAAYAALVEKGTHSAYMNIHETYPLKSRKLTRVLQRTLSALGHWSPIFGETEYLPLFTFPIVKLLQNNQLVCFEIVATLLVNWCQHWFEYFPNPPINVLSMVENVLAHHDKELLQHLVKYNVTSQIYAWPLMETLFSEVLTKEEWLQLCDNLISNPPAFMIALVVAYCTSSRGPLLHSTELDDFKYYFHHRNAINISQVIKEAYRIDDTTPPGIHPKRMMEEFVPLTRGTYPVFNKYPKFIVDYQVQERDRLRKEETEYIKQRQLTLELNQESEKHRNAEEAWYRQQQLLLDAEEKRRCMIQDEEQKLVDQRSRVQAMNREVKVKELQLLDAARRKFINHQQRQKEVDLKRLDDELERKTLMREQETQQAIEEQEVKNMELHLQRKMFEQELARGATQGGLPEKINYAARMRHHDLEDDILEKLDNSSDAFQNRMRKLLQSEMARTEQAQIDTDVFNLMETRHRMQELDRERDMFKIARLQKENTDVEQDVAGLVRHLDDSKRQTVDTGRDDYLEQIHAASLAADRRTQLAGSARGGYLKDIQNMENMFQETDNTESLASTISLDRGREELDKEEIVLMAEVRRIREKLARESRNRIQPNENYL